MKEKGGTESTHLYALKHIYTKDMFVLFVWSQILKNLSILLIMNLKIIVLLHDHIDIYPEVKPFVVQWGLLPRKSA